MLYTQKTKKMELQEIRCKKCNSTQVRFRHTTNHRICNHCGYIEYVGDDLQKKEKLENEKE